MYYNRDIKFIKNFYKNVNIKYIYFNIFYIKIYQYLIFPKKYLQKCNILLIFMLK